MNPPGFDFTVGSASTSGSSQPSPVSFDLSSQSEYSTTSDYSHDVSSSDAHLFPGASLHAPAPLPAPSHFTGHATTLLPSPSPPLLPWPEIDVSLIIKWSSDSSKSLSAPLQKLIDDRLAAMNTTSPVHPSRARARRTKSPTDGAPEHVKRPPNCFFGFRTSFNAYFRRRGSKGLSQDKLSTLVGEVWGLMPPDEKRKWKERADEEARLHQKLYPDYTYDPKKRQAAAAQRKPRNHRRVDDWNDLSPRPRRTRTTTTASTRAAPYQVPSLSHAPASSYASSSSPSAASSSSRPSPASTSSEDSPLDDRWPAVNPDDFIVADIPPQVDFEGSQTAQHESRYASLAYSLSDFSFESLSAPASRSASVASSASLLFPFTLPPPPPPFLHVPPGTLDYLGGDALAAMAALEPDWQSVPQWLSELPPAANYDVPALTEPWATPAPLPLPLPEPVPMPAPWPNTYEFGAFNDMSPFVDMAVPQFPPGEPSEIVDTAAAGPFVGQGAGF